MQERYDRQLAAAYVRGMLREVLHPAMNTWKKYCEALMSAK